MQQLGKPWQELAYVVVIEVQTVRGIPKMYKVLKYYPEYTFDLATQTVFFKSSKKVIQALKFEENQ